MSERLTVRVDAAAELMDVSKDTIRNAINSGALRAKKPGGRYLISIKALQEWFDALPDG